ncbi:MAG: recombinase RecA [Mesorhizobium sp.]|uniref:AAA family ATPase n=1 Tax=Mesorhizobium sp. TaxID=1871066 RepID=UPI000FE6FA56|nr:AAA family ATPase [Mesorhizobium sp.]RWD55389.1 MAG: recombinase RecA [Mesorhizobium sp.]RWE49276.1 MAG: recombinase RecA [Mesorhizobium sp.]
MAAIPERIYKFEPGKPSPEIPVPANDNEQTAANPALITATEWQWIDPTTIQPRQWIYGHHYIRKYVSVTVSPGGVGKTAKGIVEALSMVTGRELLGEQVHERVRVWLLNEDPREELDRRIAAACKYYDIRPGEIAGRLFVNSFRDQEFITAKQTKSETVIMAPFRHGLEAEIKRKGIDVMIVDPFVSTHAVVENDNMAIDLVIKQFWAPVIEKTGIAAELIHHSKKLGGNEVNAESARGAGSLIGAARSAIALNGMTVDEANKANVESRHVHFRATDAKANMAPKSEKSRWYKIESVDLANATIDRPADHVGVVTAWRWPDVMQGMTAADLLAVQKVINAGSYKDSSQARNWAGYAVAAALGLDVDDDKDKARIKQMLKSWKENGALKVETKEDENRKERPFIIVGDWAIQPGDD